jgi:hypothetical protein
VNWKSAPHRHIHTNVRSAGALARGMDFSRLFAEKLDRLPGDGERLAGRAGVLVHPNREGLQNLGEPEPFALAFAVERPLPPLVARASPGLRIAPVGASRLYGAEGRGQPPRSTRRATSCSVFQSLGSPLGLPEKIVSRRDGSSLPWRFKCPHSSYEVGLCSDGSHPGGQGSGERRGYRSA